MGQSRGVRGDCKSKLLHGESRVRNVGRYSPSVVWMAQGDSAEFGLWSRAERTVQHFSFAISDDDPAELTEHLVKCLFERHEGISSPGRGREYERGNAELGPI